jgi:glucokinase
LKMKLYIDIGGTHLRSELHSAEGIITDSVFTTEHDLIEVLEKILKAHPDITFIGISYAGQVNRGEILSAPNIVLSRTGIKAYFESHYNLRLEIDNDLNCAIRAEAAYFKCDSVAALYIGTGIGSAFIDEARLVRGHNNLAFEIGHIPYRETPFTCGCGKSNCIELFASGSGLKRQLEFQGIDAKPDLMRFITSDDARERKIAGEFEKALLYAAGTLITIANPKMLVLGGGVIEKNGYLLDFVRENIDGFALGASLKEMEIVQSQLDNAPIIGARLLE